MFFMITTVKFSALANRKARAIDWHPLLLLGSSGSSIAGALKPGGFDASKGVISAVFRKDPGDLQ